MPLLAMKAILPVPPPNGVGAGEGVVVGVGVKLGVVLATGEEAVASTEFVLEFEAVLSQAVMVSRIEPKRIDNRPALIALYLESAPASYCASGKRAC